MAASTATIQETAMAKSFCVGATKAGGQDIDDSSRVVRVRLVRNVQRSLLYYRLPARRSKQTWRRTISNG